MYRPSFPEAPTTQTLIVVPRYEPGTKSAKVPPAERSELIGHTVRRMPEFALQFPIQQVPEYAARYADDDAEVLAIARAVRDRGHYTLDEFRRVCRWKTPRSAPLVGQNSSESVEAATRVALSEVGSERERIEALLELRGVGWPTASVLVHLVYPERFPILDKRALHALGVDAAPARYTFEYWEPYVAAYTQLLEQAGVDGRTLDQALWQWSKEQGTPIY